MFRAARVVLLNKTDLLPHVPFDVDRFVESVRLVNPAVRVIPVSALRGAGLDAWYEWVRQQAVLSPLPEAGRGVAGERSAPPAAAS